jgi:hypothetical protein
MLCDEVIVQHNICKHYEKHSAYEGAVQQEQRLSLAHRQTASTFKRICLVYLRFMSKQGMVDEHRFFEEMYNRICEENGPADPAPRHCLGNGAVASNIWW